MSHKWKSEEGGTPNSHGLIRTPPPPQNNKRRTVLLKETAKGNLELKSETPRKIQKYVQVFLQKEKDAKPKANGKKAKASATKKK